MNMTYLLLSVMGVSAAFTLFAAYRKKWMETLVFGFVAFASGRALMGMTLLILLIAFLAGVALWVVWAHRSRTSATVTRLGARSRRKVGVASTTDIVRRAGATAARRKATAVRPSLRTLPLHKRLRVPVREFAIQLCRVGPVRMHVPMENVIVVFGGPRYGKSEWLKCTIIDAPGAVLVTSTRTDLHDETGPLRERRGPVYVFNPTGLAGFTSTVTFDPLVGCKEPSTAMERAADMLAADGGGDREWWDAQGRRVLAMLLHAAALGDLTMRHVLAWASDPKDSERQLTGLLRRSPEPSFADMVSQFAGSHSGPQSSISTTIMPALNWLNSPAACAAAIGGTPFDVRQLLRERGTVYLLGEGNAIVAPLVAALTGYIAREARRQAALSTNGRLDPGLTLALDEAALVCPVPLDEWTADMGGRGICIIAVFQSLAQMRARWGAQGANVILTNAGATMLFGGTKGDDLDDWVKLAGDRDEPVVTTNAEGKVVSRTVRKVPVLSASQLSDLPEGRVMVKFRGIAVVLGTAPKARRRRDVRRLAAELKAQREREAAAVVTAADSFTAESVPAQRAELVTAEQDATEVVTDVEA